MILADAFNFTLLLQESVAPLVLVSGIGLVILVVNARFMHVTDRLRGLLNKGEAGSSEEVTVLYRRARLLQGSLAALSGSIVSTTLLVMCVISNHFTSHAHYGGIVFLVISSILIGVSAILFFLDVFNSLRALKLAIEHRNT